MHSLEVIVDKNERAAGREAAQAKNDGNVERFNNIVGQAEITDKFVAGYTAGRKEG